MEKLLFRVTNEETILFKDDKKLFLIQTDDSGKHFGLEVVTKTKGFGRVNSPSIDTCNEVFELVVKRLHKFTSYASAVKYVKNLFSLNRLYLIRFAIQAESMKISQADVKTVARKTGCRLITKYNHASDIKKPGWKTIQAVTQDDELLGEFVGKSFSNEMKFVANNKIDLGIINELIDFA